MIDDSNAEFWGDWSGHGFFLGVWSTVPGDDADRRVGYWYATTTDDLVATGHLIETPPVPLTTPPGADRSEIARWPISLEMSACDSKHEIPDEQRAARWAPEHHIDFTSSRRTDLAELRPVAESGRAMMKRCGSASRWC